MLTRPFRPAEEIIMAVLLPDARELSDEVLDALRVRAVRGCELGFTEADVAQLLGDRLRAHATPEVEAWVDAHRDRIELFYRPRYAPELNATEYLNNDLKGQVSAAGLPDNKSQLRSPMQRFMNKLR